MNERPDKFAEYSPFLFALRELQGVFATPRTYAILIGIVAVLALSGPFGTQQDLTLPGRLGFWLPIVFAGFAVGYLAGSVVGRWGSQRGYSRLFTYTLAGLASGISVLPVVLAINLILLGSDITEPAYLLRQLVNCFVIAAVVTLNMAFFSKRDDKAAASVAGRDEPDRLIRRLPLEKRGRIVSLSVNDHYVEVTTTRGTTSLLIRLKDAIEEVDRTEGLQIHRSHWVALPAIRQIKRENGSVIAVTEDGSELPVSRTYVPALKELGLLPS
jgi:hypothetical protein